LLAALASTLIKIEGRATDEAAQNHHSDGHETLVRRSFYCVEGDIIINMDPPRGETAASQSLPQANAMSVSLPLQQANGMSTFRGRQWTSHYHGDGEFIVNLDPPVPDDVANPKLQRADFAFKPPTVTPDPGHAEVEAPEGDTASAVANRRFIISLPEIYGDVGKWIVFDSLGTYRISAESFLHPTTLPDSPFSCHPPPSIRSLPSPLPRL
jgi:hypothetical protein